MQGIIHRLAYSYHWTKTEILDRTYLDEALYYMDQITAERLEQQLIDINTTSSPYYKQMDRTQMLAKLKYQIAKLRGEYDDEQDVDDATIKRNMGKLKAFFSRKQEEFKSRQI